MKRQSEFAIADRYFEEYQRIGKKPPGHRNTLWRWRNYDDVPSTYYMQRAAFDGCDVHYILTGRRKVGNDG